MDQHQIAFVSQQRKQCGLTAGVLLHPAQNGRGLIDDGCLFRRTELPPRGPANTHHLVQNAVTLNGQWDSGYLVGDNFRRNRAEKRHVRSSICSTDYCNWRSQRPGTLQRGLRVRPKLASVPNFAPLQMKTSILTFQRIGIVGGRAYVLDVVPKLLESFLVVVEHDHAIA